METKSYNSQDKKYLLIELDNKEIINYQVEIINNNAEIFLLPIRERKVNSTLKIEVDISEKYSVEQYIKSRMLTYDLFLKISFKICDIHLKCEEYLLNHKNLLIQDNTIFIDRSNEEIYMIYLPINNNISDRNIENLKEYIKSLSQSITYVNSKQQYALINEIFRYLNSKDIDVRKIKSKIEEAIKSQNAENIVILSQPTEVKREVVVKEKTFFEKIKLAFKNKDRKEILDEMSNSKDKLKNKSISEGNKNINDISVINSDSNNKKLRGYLIIKKSYGEETIELVKDVTLLGRMHGVVDYVLDSDVVGRVHARIEKINNDYYITDLGSKNGSYLNGTRLIANEKYRLENNSHIKLANINLYFSMQ